MRTFRLSFLLTVLLSMVGANVFAHDIAVENDDGVTIYYNFINDGTELEVTYRGSSYLEYTDRYVGHVTIPESVTLGNNVYPVTSIGFSAFYNCSNLTSLTIPNTITIIGQSACNSSGLTSITIHSNVTSIGSNAFMGCSELVSIVVAEENTVYDSRNNCNAIIETATNTLLWGCQNSIIPDGVTSIRDNAFYKCSGLTSVTIPNSVTSIGSSVFDGCSALTSVIIPNSVTAIGYNAFMDCSSLTSVTIGNGVISIGNHAFSDCSALTEVAISDGEGTLSIGSSIFRSCPIETLHLGRNLGNDNSSSPFSSNKSLKTVTIGNNVTSIGNAAFRNCGSLTSANIGNGVTSIGNEAFSGCSALISVNIPDGVTSIGDEAFSYCNSLTSVVIPNSVTSLGDEALRNCHHLNEVTIGNGVTSIGNYVFSNCSALTSVNIPEGVTSIGDYAFYGCSGLTEITIPNSVTSIGEGAFQSCLNIREMSIPNGVTSIGQSAFYDCHFTSVTIPSSVISIGNNAFSWCRYLKTVVSLIEEPFAINTVFSSIDANATLYVPQGTKEKYLATEGWNVFASIEEMDHDDITLGEVGKGTYCSEYDLDFTDVEGLKAYIASGYDYATGTVLLTNVKEVPAGTGVMLIGTEGTYQVPYCSEKSQYYYLNMLKGIQQAQTVPQTEDGYTNYILKDGDEGVLFYKVTGQGTVAAHRAYLQIPTVEAEARPMLNFMIDDETTGTETTGIDATLMNNGERTNKAFYNLNGQRVEQPKQGIYIQNGKKIIIR